MSGRTSRRRGVRRWLVPLWASLLSGVIGISGSSAEAVLAPTVAGATTFRSVGTKQLRVVIPVDTSITSDVFEIDADIDTPGLYGGILLRELGADFVSGDRAGSVRAFSPAPPCGPSSCYEVEWDNPLGGRIEWLPDGRSRALLRAGTYLATLIADRDSAITATIRFDGLLGRADLTLDDPAPNVSSAPTADTRTPTVDVAGALDQPATLDGGITGTMTIPGASVILGWTTAEWDVSSAFEFCVGRPGPPTFDSDGDCAKPRNGMYSNGLGSVTLSMWGGNCWFDQEPNGCGPGPVRVAYRVSGGRVRETGRIALSQQASGIGLWIGFDE